MSEVFERPISHLHSQGYNAISAHVRRDGPWLIFKWLALIFFKAHLKDASLRFHLDFRKGSQKIGNVYPQEDFYHVHCVARSFHTGARLNAPVLGSFFILPGKTGTPFGDFDYSDLYGPKTMLLRLGEIVFVAALMDSCTAFNFIGQWMSKITRWLSPMQIREFMSHVAFINLHLDDRLDFLSEFKPDENQYMITAEHPPMVKLRHSEKRDFGEILHKLCLPAVEYVPPEDRDSFIESLKTGRRTFLFDENGSFILNSIQLLDGAALIKGARIHPEEAACGSRPIAALPAKGLVTTSPTTNAWRLWRHQHRAPRAGLPEAHVRAADPKLYFAGWVKFELGDADRLVSRVSNHGRAVSV